MVRRSMVGWIAVLAIFWLGGGGAGEVWGQGWRARDLGDVTPIGEGAWYVKREVARGGVRADLDLIFFDSEVATLRVVERADGEGREDDLASAMGRVGAWAGINGGFFTEDDQPLGLQIVDGERTGQFQRGGNLLGGLVLVREGWPMVWWRDEYQDVAGTTQLVQAGPRLVVEGEAVELGDERRRRRSFVATDKGTLWAMGRSDALALGELASALADPAVIREFRVVRALNLDGGTSSGLWWRERDGEAKYLREFKTVRNYLAVVPR